MANRRIDRNSTTWQAVLDWAQNRRDGEVERLIGGAHPEQDERIRGRIQAIDELLSLPD